MFSPPRRSDRLGKRTRNTRRPVRRQLAVTVAGGPARIGVIQKPASDALRQITVVGRTDMLIVYSQEPTPFGVLLQSTGMLRTTLSLPFRK